MALVAVLSCSKREAAWVDRVEVDTLEGGEIIGLTQQGLSHQAGAKLEQAGFKIAGTGKPLPADAKPWRVSLAAAVGEPDAETRSSTVSVVLELRHMGDAEGLSLDAHQQVKAEPTADVETMQGALSSALSDALDELVREAAATIALEKATPDVLKQKAHSTDVPTKNAAVALLVRQRDEAALPVLLERLQTDDVHTLHAVMGSLVELRSPKAVNPLIGAAQRRGPVFEREVIFAVSAIGGTDAEAYLDLVASGSEDPLLRASAEQALKELRARRERQPR